MKRGFEKISSKEFSKYFNNKASSNEYNLPKRATKKSAGYDFEIIEDVKIKSKEIVKIPTGIKSYMQEDEVLMLVIRSSLGVKNSIRLLNQIGVIDADYYNNSENEGHIFVFLENRGNTDITLKKGDKFIQGIFTKYLIIDGDEVTTERKGGFGSTNGGII